MKVKCVLCDKIEAIEDETLLAKRLRNRPIHTYLCNECYGRISDKTQAKIDTGNFRLYRTRSKEEDW